MSSIRATALVSGRVQGVGFRAWVGRVAEPLGLSGHAKNLPDGRVEVVAEGERAGVEKLLRLLGEEPTGTRRPGRVSEVAVEYGDARGEAGFRRL
ncbi:acylphosphatase [Corynebacterium guangdongense]|uniref:acylphosphatase n=1 Tax=Corynebacterium guangdongense TaxID=1783348 RepID=A0ABU1ZXZ4_9CORY|nr:acylphosphatase [Corynebacterium guangdongense]MDR7329645.1 acylphosphatase [Corynebacterium guangdongense]WJZ18209.1 Acylphosphatase [Corynebacterium guangdongense]